MLYEGGFISPRSYVMNKVTFIFAFNRIISPIFAMFSTIYIHSQFIYCFLKHLVDFSKYFPSILFLFLRIKNILKNNSVFFIPSRHMDMFPRKLWPTFFNYELSWKLLLFFLNRSFLYSYREKSKTGFFKLESPFRFFTSS